ncbi:MAG: inositol 2-dehydrogenase [Rectinemataceae bacterium]|jgi:myo-inositol 2-dehydrogenase/D-chiro-inositol 1-dehydrogenase
MSKLINVGIIGAGRIGKLHAENIAYSMPQTKLVAIADVNMTPAIETWAKGLGVEKILKDPAALIADKSIQAVLVCASTDTHADFVVKLANAGKHIFCEKPVDLTTAKVRAALEAVKKAGVQLQVGFNRRFDHNFRRVRELVESGAIGTPQIIKITSRDPAPPSPAYVAVSGGIFLDMSIHDFDMARFQAGSEVVEVYAAGAVLVDEAIGKAGDVDTAIITLRFANGALAVIDNSRKAAYGYDQRVEVFGSKGSAAAENDCPSTVRLSGESGVVADKPLYFFLERYKEAFIAEMRAFLDAVSTGKPCPVTGEDGLQDLLVGLAAKKSLAEGRPVKLSEIA